MDKNYQEEFNGRINRGPSKLLVREFFTLVKYIRAVHNA